MVRAAPAITVSVSVLAQLVRYLGHLRIDPREVFRTAGLARDILERPDTQIPIEDYLAVEVEAARIAADPCFGLHMGEYHDPGHWSLLGYLMMNCRNLGEAMEKSGRYARIVGNLIGGTVQIGLGKARFVLSTPRYAPRMSRHCFECVISSGVSMARRLTGRLLSPIEVGFSYPAPESPDEYHRVLRCPVLFDRKQTYMVWPTAVAKIPVVAPSPALLERFESYARDYVAEIEGTDATTRAVTRHILSHLDNTTVSVRSAAQALAVSVRTLQNRLKAEGTSFAGLLEATRERLARRHLRENMTVEDITYLLGFSEPSAFRKAFKKWTGTTPREYRVAARAGPGQS